MKTEGLVNFPLCADNVGESKKTLTELAGVRDLKEEIAKRRTEEYTEERPCGGLGPQ